MLSCFKNEKKETRLNTKPQPFHEKHERVGKVFSLSLIKLIEGIRVVEVKT